MSILKKSDKNTFSCLGWRMTDNRIPQALEARRKALLRGIQLCSTLSEVEVHVCATEQKSCLVAFFFSIIDLTKHCLRRCQGGRQFRSGGPITQSGPARASNLMTSDGCSASIRAIILWINCPLTDNYPLLREVSGFLTFSDSSDLALYSFHSRPAYQPALGFVYS